jgi:hypothetical protein
MKHVLGHVGGVPAWQRPYVGPVERLQVSKPSQNDESWHWALLVHSTHMPDELHRRRGSVVHCAFVTQSTHPPKTSLQNWGAWQLVGVCSHAFVTSLQESTVQNKLSLQLFGVVQ